jgi:hypothetical protein
MERVDRVVGPLLFLVFMLLVMFPPRDSDPLELFLGSKKYSLLCIPMENISWAQVTLTRGRNHARR